MMASLVLLDNTWPGYIMVELFSEIKSVTINHKEVQTSNKLFYCSNVDLFELFSEMFISWNGDECTELLAYYSMDNSMQGHY